jgi:tripartite-type tricarboxylate transporter receptor subunit TctC
MFDVADVDLNHKGVNMNRRTFLLALLAALFSAEAYADGPVVKFILPNATGSGVDAITRAAQPALARALGAPVVIENQPGAGGVVGLQALARSQPDGNTLAMVSNNVVIFPSVLRSLPFDMPNDFTPIAIVGTTPMVLVVNPKNMPARDAKEFFGMLRAKPGTYNFASGGNGTILHLASELVLEAGAATAKHIPYKGVGPMVTDLMGGQVDFGTLALPSVLGQIKSGTLRPIGMLTPTRTPAAPEIPTFAEQELKDFAVEAWFAVIGPRNIPAAQIKRAHSAIVEAFNDPAVKEAMAKQGNTINISTPEQAQAAFRRELAKYADLVKRVGLEPQ